MLSYNLAIVCTESNACPNTKCTINIVMVHTTTLTVSLVLCDYSLRIVASMYSYYFMGATSNVILLLSTLNQMCTRHVQTITTSQLSSFIEQRQMCCHLILLLCVLNRMCNPMLNVSLILSLFIQHC